MTLATLPLDTPIGRLQLVADDEALVALHLPNHEADAGGRPAPAMSAGHPILERARQQLLEYFAAERQVFDLPLSPQGTAFQRSVWRALYDIPFGVTCSYGELASALGRPSASRAVGSANGKNPIAIIIPCHRVIGANGSLTGYGGGLPTKEWLLRHERAARAAQA